MRKGSTSLAMRKRQNKIKMSYSFTPMKITRFERESARAGRKGEGRAGGGRRQGEEGGETSSCRQVGSREPWRRAGGREGCRRPGKRPGARCQDGAPLPLVRHLHRWVLHTRAESGACTPTFLATFLTAATTAKPSQGPSTDEQLSHRWAPPSGDITEPSRGGTL